MNELELVRLYAKSWNTLNPEVIKPYLAIEVVYESQQVFSTLNGKEEVYKLFKG